MLKSALVIGVSVAAVAGVTAVAAGPMTREWLDERRNLESSYATGREAKAGDASVPAWLPDSATKVRFKVRPSGGDRLLTAHLPDGRLPDACVAARGHKRPALTAAWFPRGVVLKGTAHCGRYSAYTEGNTLYAWQRDTHAHPPAEALGSDRRPIPAASLTALVTEMRHRAPARADFLRRTGAPLDMPVPGRSARTPVAGSLAGKQ